MNFEICLGGVKCILVLIFLNSDDLLWEFFFCKNCTNTDITVRRQVAPLVRRFLSFSVFSFVNVLSYSIRSMDNRISNINTELFTLQTACMHTTNVMQIRPFYVLHISTKVTSQLPSCLHLENRYPSSLWQHSCLTK